MVERITSRSANASYTAGHEGGSSPSASGSEDVLRVVRPPRRRTGLKWARSTEADGEGDVREPATQESAPPRLTTGLSSMASFATLTSPRDHHNCLVSNDFLKGSRLALFVVSPLSILASLAFTGISR